MDNNKSGEKTITDTAELLKDVDLDAAEYNFSVDDILAEFGLERHKEEKPEPEEQQPVAQDENPELGSIFGQITASLERERIEQAIRGAEAERMSLERTVEIHPSESETSETKESPVQVDYSKLGSVVVEDGQPAEEPLDDEEERIREISRNIEKAAESPVPSAPEYTERIHVFEEVERDEKERKKKRRRGRNTEDDSGPRKVVMKEAQDTGKLFSANLGEIFGSSEGLEEARKVGGVTEKDAFEEEEEKRPRRRRRSKRDERKLEEEMFGEAQEIREEEHEPREQNVSVEERFKEITAMIGRSKLRIAGAWVVTLLLCMLTVAPRLGITLPQGISYIYHPFFYLFMNLAAGILVMLLCYEVIVTGLRDLITLKPNMESVVSVSCIATAVHTVSVMMFPQWEGYLPFTAVSSLSLVIAAMCRRKWLVACARNYRTVSGMSKPYIVGCEDDYYDGQEAVVKYKAQKALYFVNQTERTDFARRAWRVLAPVCIAAAVILSAVSTIGRGEPQRFLWCLSAMTAASAPFSLALPYFVPFAKVTRRLAAAGEAIAGWSAAEELGSVHDVVVTDSDIFPRGSVSLNGLKVFGNFQVDRVISYSASLISASGTGIARAFEDLLRDQSGTMKKVSSFKFYENGGIGGEIDGCSVLAGTASFMARTGIRVPRDVSGKTMIFVAINLELAGIFAVNYAASGAVRRGFRALEHYGLTPIFAVRDFNITPSMIESKFKLSTDTVDYPQISQRLALSDPDRMYFSKPSAVLNREGLGHYAESIAAARNLRRTTKLCLALSIICMVIAMLIMFYLTYIHAPATASPSNLLLYMFLWLLPAWLVTNWVNA